MLNITRISITNMFIFHYNLSQDSTHPNKHLHVSSFTMFEYEYFLNWIESTWPGIWFPSQLLLLPGILWRYKTESGMLGAITSNLKGIIDNYYNKGARKSVKGEFKGYFGGLWVTASVKYVSYDLLGYCWLNFNKSRCDELFYRCWMFFIVH